MAKTSVDIPQLKFNKMSTAKYEELKLAGQLVDNEFYITPDGGTIPEVNETTNDFVLSNNGTDLNWIQETEYTKNRIDSKLNDNVRTNCITKIPQDIKLELSDDGTLTLKAGSKVYIPNGFEEDGITKKFDVKIIEEDIIYQDNYGFENKHFLFISTNNRIFAPEENICLTQETAPSDNQYIMWYDLANNVIKWSDTTGTSWYEYNVSLPICAGYLTDASKWSNIENIFNGFGYIDSTIFTLPNVECYIPNGYNNDGSLNNIKCNTLKIQPISPAEAKFDLAYYCVYENNVWGFSLPSNIIAKNNTIIDSYYNLKCMIACIISTDSTGHITSFNPKNVFQTVDRNDTNWASSTSKPSNRYIDLTLEASGTTYTVPANGWICIGGNCTGYISLYSPKNHMCSFIAPDIGNYPFARTFLPVSKNDTFGVDYALFNVDTFRFIYDEGEI